MEKFSFFPFFEKNTLFQNNVRMNSDDFAMPADTTSFSEQNTNSEEISSANSIGKTENINAVSEQDKSLEAALSFIRLHDEATRRIKEKNGKRIK